MKIFHYLILMFLMVGSSACIQLGNPPLPSQYFVFEPITENTEHYSSKSLTISVELIEFPEYLKRPQIVVQRQQNIIYFSDSHRWATPLDGQLLSLLSSNVELLLPHATIRVSPWHNNRRVDYNLQLAVKKFSGTLNHQSIIDIRWHIVGQDGEKHSGQYLDQRSIDGSYEGLVRALNHGLEGLSRELAVELAKPGR